MIIKLHHHRRTAPLKLSAALFFIKDRILIPLIKNPQVIATALFFAYIYGISGGNDIKHVTDADVFARAAIATAVWIIILLLSIPYRAFIDKINRPRR